MCKAEENKCIYYYNIYCILLFLFFNVSTSPEILKHEMKVFFVKYNDPIYVKLEKLDIMIRLASQANIAQVNETHTHTLHFTNVKHDPCLILCSYIFLLYHSNTVESKNLKLLV